MSLNGYDISNNQGNINNGLVPGDFVIIKATEGVGFVDPDCDANYQQSKAANKLLGIYHFARPDGNSAVDEANFFVDNVQGYLGEAVLVLDLETQPITPGWAKAWLDQVFNRTGIRAWLYINQSTANNHDWSSVWNDYALWVAAYGTNVRHDGYQPSDNISVNGNWNIAAWQYTSNGFLPNWGSPLDLDVFYGDADAWKKYARPESAPQPVVVAPTPEPVVEPQPVVVTPAPAPDPTPVVTPTVPVNTPTPAPEPSNPPVTPAPEPVPQPAPTTDLPIKINFAFLVGMAIVAGGIIWALVQIFK